MRRQVAQLSFHFLRPAQARSLLVFIIFFIDRVVAAVFRAVSILLGQCGPPLRRALQLDIFVTRVLRHQVLHIGVLGCNLLSGQSLLTNLAEAARTRILLLVLV